MAAPSMAIVSNLTGVDARRGGTHGRGGGGGGRVGVPAGGSDAGAAGRLAGCGLCRCGWGRCRCGCGSRHGGWRLGGADGSVLGATIGATSSSSVEPRVTCEPSVSTRGSTMRIPSANVPLELPMSVSTTSPSRSVRERWCLDTLASVRMTPAHSLPTSTVPEIVTRTGSAPGSRISTTGSDTVLSLRRSRDATGQGLRSARGEREGIDASVSCNSTTSRPSSLEWSRTLRSAFWRSFADSSPRIWTNRSRRCSRCSSRRASP